jgi:transcriptional regulator with XRE-family HTH domain
MTVAVASALRKWREQQGWTLIDLSGLTGVSVSYLSLIERGLRNPPPHLKVHIARGIGAAVADVFPPPDREAVRA